MIKFKECERFELNDKINIVMNIECDVCGHDLKTFVANKTIRVLPCKHCIESKHVEGHEKHVILSEEEHNRILDRRIEQNEKSIEMMRDSIRKEFTQRFDEFLKNPKVILK